jgi:hypothetical protein
MFRSQLLDLYGIDIAILGSVISTAQMYVGGAAPLALTDALAEASNLWTVEDWLDDDRLYAALSLPYEDPTLAVKAIERWGDHPRFVHVLLPFRTQRPLGNSKYWAMYEAATAYDLPIAVHPGNGSNGMLTGAGWPSYYYEDHVGTPHALLNHVASMICEGVFDRFPTLKIVLQEGGWSWITSYGRRFDRAWGQLREEIPDLQRKPSEYIRDHFWYTTQPVEEPPHPHQFIEALEQFGQPDRLLYASDYPHWDFDPPQHGVPGVVSADIRRAIMGENAVALYPKLAHLRSRCSP